jgi:hypothetical protein
MLELDKLGKKTDWKENLSIEAEQELNQLLERVKKHRCAYRSAENVQIAQLWCALIEIVRMIKELDGRLSRIEKLLDKVFRSYEEDKDKLIKSLLRF